LVISPKRNISDFYILVFFFIFINLAFKNEGMAIAIKYVDFVKLVKITTLVVFIGIHCSLFSQRPKELLIPFLEGTKYGFVDKEGNMVIAPRYDLAYPFYSGYSLTMVVHKGKPLLINRAGKKVAEASTDYLDENALARQEIFDFWPEAVALNNGKLVDSCPDFKIFMKVESHHVFDKIGNLYSVKYQNKVFLIDEKGRSKSKEFDRINHFRMGEIEYAITEDHSLNKYGLLNGMGEQLLECVYDGIQYQEKGVFELTQSGKTYLYKTNYDSNFQTKELPFNAFNPNRIIGRRNGKFGVTDTMNNVLLPFENNKLYPLAGDNFLFWKTDSVGIVNLQKGIVSGLKLKVKMDGIIGLKDFVPYMPYTQDLAFLNDGEYWQLVTTTGKVLFQDVACVNIDFQNVMNQVAGIALGQKQGVIDSSGTILVDFVYDAVYGISDNFTFVVRHGNTYSWLKHDGSYISKAFDDFRYILKNHLLVKKNNKWFFIDVSGRMFLK
jgi:hypothetical protein